MKSREGCWWLNFATAVLLGFCVIALACFLGGCRSSGVRVVASSRSIMSVGDINWDEYKIPVFSIYSGPHLTFWVNRDFLYMQEARAYGTVTNDVSALGIYASRENKTAGVDLHFALVGTNVETRVESDATP